jgi:hypothetical protein
MSVLSNDGMKGKFTGWGGQSMTALHAGTIAHLFKELKRLNVFSLQEN